MGREIFIRDIIEGHRQGYYKPEKALSGDKYLVRITELTDSGWLKLSKNTPRIRVHENDASSFSIKAGDFLFARTGGAGRFGLITKDVKGVFASYLIRFRFKRDWIPEFLRFYFLSDSFQNQIRSKIHGGVNQNVHAEDIKSSSIPYFETDEQKRIVSKLDALFERIDQSIVLLEENLTHTQALMSSVLDEEFGRFKNTEYQKLDDVTAKIGSGATPKGGQKSYKSEGISLIRSMNVHDFYFKEKNLAFIDESQADKLKVVTVEQGDVLLNITGASVARCCMVNPSFLPARVNQHVSIIRPKKELLSEFLMLFLISPSMKSKLLFDSSGNATREAITKKMIQNLKVPIPSIEDQKESIRRIQAIFDKSKESIEQFNQKLNNLKSLKSSLLDKAFKGEL